MKRNSGFTLIELMICVAIIAILLAIAIPACTTSGPRIRHQVVCTGEAGLLSSKTADFWSFIPDSGTYVSYDGTSFSPRPGDSCDIKEVRSAR